MIKQISDVYSGFFNRGLGAQWRWAAPRQGLKVGQSSRGGGREPPSSSSRGLSTLGSAKSSPVMGSKAESNPSDEGFLPF